MPDRFYGIALGGQTPDAVTEAAATTSLAIELRINDTVYGSKQRVLEALQAVRDYLVAKEGNPIS